MRRSSRFSIGAAAFGLFVLSPALAQDASLPDGPSTQGNVSVTVYNGGTSLVQDIRRLAIASGTSRIEFPDVSAQIQPETVSFSAEGATIVEQNFDYDLLTPGKLMEKAVGETITLIRTNPATGAETRERAKVLSVNQGVVVQIGNRIEVLRDDGLPVRAVFDKVPENLRARPTLSITVDSQRAGQRDAAIRYLTGGLGWSADYVALFDEAKGSIDVQGWVTLSNSSGTTYRNADTLLVAGNPQGASGFGNRRGNIRSAGTETANRERLGDYYLYPVGRTTIADRQTKQINFLDVQGVPAMRAYEYRVGWLASMSEPQSADTVVKFSSSKSGGLGDALPAGAVRFYQRDQRGSPQFIGENSIGHTPMGSALALKTGEAFDVKVKSIVVERKRLSSSKWQTSMRYELTNARDGAVTIDLMQSGLDFGWTDTRIVTESQKSERRNSDAVVWAVNVPANGSAEVTATFETRY
ncbi:DUF4139 domain-containing protein [Blastomonas sp. UPD001]|jgi:hypothetical protein|uniref:DUF4139 domain-containing protein n=1 Tax=Blastomonas sp. UPD001 TaxID=2217673 RepID=UPI000E34D6C4|nr:DUF4139 domain-containing protein [Blastomonas sp. UPD001]MBL0966312.1 DUF4139 domain-containing protein [Blastomonas sp.]